MTDDEAAFLAARLDEDEAAANDERVWFGPFPETIKESEGELIIQKERVLAEVAAKRAILGAYENAKARYDSQVTMRDLAEDRHLAGTVFGLKNAISELIAVYSDHPGYREEWKP